MLRIVCSVGVYLSLLTALFALSGGCRAALALDTVPAAINQPANHAGWAENAVMLSVANAGRRLVAVGERGFVLLSDDEGRTWQQSASVPTSVTLTKVGFADDKAGWAVGHMGVILHTTDGGSTWVKQLDGVEAAKLAADHARQALAQVAGPASLEWQKQVQSADALVRDGPDKPFLTLVVRDVKKSFAFGAFGLAFLTEDGGRTWTPLTGETSSARGRHIYGAAELDKALYLAGEEGLILRSNADGTFAAAQIPYSGTLFGITAVSKDLVLAFGLNGSLLRFDPTTNQWVQVKSSVDASLTSGLALADGRIVLGSLGGQIVGSSDGGRTFASWAMAPQPVTGLAEAADGYLIVAGPRGMSRIELQQRSGAK